MVDMFRYSSKLPRLEKFYQIIEAVNHIHVIIALSLQKRSPMAEMNERQRRRVITRSEYRKQIRESNKSVMKKENANLYYHNSPIVASTLPELVLRSMALPAFPFLATTWAPTGPDHRFNTSTSFPRSLTLPDIVTASIFPSHC